VPGHDDRQRLVVQQRGVQGDRSALAGTVEADLVGPDPRVRREPAQGGERVVGSDREQGTAGQDECPILLVGVDRVEPQREARHALVAQRRSHLGRGTDDQDGGVFTGTFGEGQRADHRSTGSSDQSVRTVAVVVAVSNGVGRGKGQPLHGGTHPAGPLTRIPVGRCEPKQRGAFEQPVHACVLH
jgi:hypothetical protein